MASYNFKIKIFSTFESFRMRHVSYIRWIYSNSSQILKKIGGQSFAILFAIGFTYSYSLHRRDT